jgi:hypothetical protein
LSQPMMNLCPCAALRAPDVFPIPYNFVPWVQPSLGLYKKDNEDPKEKEMQFPLKFLIIPLREGGPPHTKRRGTQRPKWTRLKEAPPRSGYFTWDQFRQLCAELPPHARPPVTIDYLERDAVGRDYVPPVEAGAFRPSAKDRHHHACWRGYQDFGTPNADHGWRVV